MRLSAPAGVLVCLATLLGCRAPDDVNVYVAASMGAAMQEALADEPGVRVSAAGSQTLARQIASGAPASLFLPAAVHHLEEPGVAARLGRSHMFLCNRLALVAAGSSGVTRLEHLSRVESLVLGVSEVPVGAYADALLDSATAEYGRPWRRAVDEAVRSRELDARQVAARVASGEADAAIVYRTDAVAAGLHPIELPAAHSPGVRYAMAPLLDGPHPARAAALVERFAAGDFDRAFVARGFERCP